MLRVLAVLDGDAENLEEAVRRIAHKAHHEPAEQCGRWTVKVFGARTPKAHALANAARTIAAEGKTVLLAQADSSELDDFELRRGQDTLLKIRHPRAWIDGRLDATDAWEFCLEEWGDPEDVVKVAGIDPGDKRMQFLWDADEAKLVAKNVISNNEPGFVKELIAMTKRRGIDLPEAVQAGITKKNTVHGFFVAVFDWQLQTFKTALSECQLSFDEQRLDRCFGESNWDSAWVDSELGSFGAVLGSLGVTSLEKAYEDEGFAEDLIERLNARKSFKEKEGQPQTLDLWDSLKTFNTCEMVFDATRRLKPVSFGDTSLSIPTSEIGYLFMLAWSIDREVDWLLEVKLPKDRFALLDGSEFEWWRLHCRHSGSKEVYRFRHGNQILLHVSFTPRFFFADPEGDAEFAANAHRFHSGYAREARVSFYEFLCGLPDKTKLSLYTHSPFNPMPMTTTIFRGVVRDARFEIASRYPEVEADELTSGIERLRESHEAGSLDSAAMSFKKASANTFWDTTPFEPRLLTESGRLKVNQVPERGPSPVRAIATAVKKFSRDFSKLGFEYCGTIEAPTLGSAKVMCFTGAEDCTGHIVLETGAIRPEFWSRFESGDILSTNTSDFFGMIESHPDTGLYYRTYYDRPLSRLLKKHRAGIQRFVEHKGTQPIVHEPDLSAFAENLVHFVGRHPLFKALVN